MLDIMYVCHFNCFTFSFEYENLRKYAKLLDMCKDLILESDSVVVVYHPTMRGRLR